MRIKPRAPLALLVHPLQLLREIAGDASAVPVAGGGGVFGITAVVGAQHCVVDPGLAGQDEVEAAVLPGGFDLLHGAEVGSGILQATGGVHGGATIAGWTGAVASGAGVEYIQHRAYADGRVGRIDY